MKIFNLQTSVDPTKALEITLNKTYMLLININLCHQVHSYGGRWGSVTLYISDDSRGGKIINV